MAVQIRISRAQHDETRLGWVFPVQEHHQAQAPLQRLVPHDGGIQVQMRLLFSCAEVLETAQVLEVDLPSIFAPGSPSLWVRTGVEKQAVGVAPQAGDRVQIETDDFINIFLLCIVAIHTMIDDSRRQAMPMRTQLLLVEVDSGFFRRSWQGLLSRRRLRHGERKSAPACDIDYGERGNLQSTLGTARTAVEEVPETERLLATLGDERRIMRRDQFRVRVERRHQHALMKVGPVKRLPKLPGDGAFSIVAVATQFAEVDATAQHEDRDEQRGKKLPLWLTEPGYLLQDVVNNCHKPLTGSSGSGIRSPHLTSSRLRLFSPFAQKMSEVLQSISTFETLPKVAQDRRGVVVSLCCRRSCLRVSFTRGPIALQRHALLHTLPVAAQSARVSPQSHHHRRLGCLCEGHCPRLSQRPASVVSLSCPPRRLSTTAPTGAQWQRPKAMGRQTQSALSDPLEAHRAAPLGHAPKRSLRQPGSSRRDPAPGQTAPTAAR